MFLVLPLSFLRENVYCSSPFFFFEGSFVTEFCLLDHLGQKIKANWIEAQPEGKIFMQFWRVVTCDQCLQNRWEPVRFEPVSNRSKFKIQI